MLVGRWSWTHSAPTADPVWSPNSGHLAYWNDGRIDVADTATGQVQILSGSAFHDDDPAWRADGETLRRGAQRR
jgi:Tol biopolymer transport system component